MVKRLILIAIVLAITTAAQAGPTYSGSLSYPSGIDATGSWANSATTFEWRVTLDGLWHYQYKLTVPSTAGDVSHLIIEVSDDLKHWEIRNPTPDIQDDDPRAYSEGPSNPGMPPSGVYGIKFEATANTKVFEASFDSRRNPMWGDFYAVDGQQPGNIQAAWNSGFGDPNPIAPYWTDPSDPSVFGHILVPDTTWIPAPGAILLGGIGVSIVGWLRRRGTL